MNVKKLDRKTCTRILLLLCVMALVVAPPEVSQADDTFLFRVQSGKPYVYVVFDTSSSMNLSAELGGVMVDANGDDTRSTFQQAKSAVYEVFNRAYKESGDFIHYGFMSYNQDGLRVRGKHWLYQFNGIEQLEIGEQLYPLQDELLVFGADLPTSATPDPAVIEQPADGFLGTCENPVDFNTYRDLINRFPKLHPVDTDGDGYVNNMLWHLIWLREGDTTYALLVEKHSSADHNFLVGEQEFLVDFTLFTADDACLETTQTQKKTLKFSLVTPFLMHDLLGADNASDIVDLSPPPPPEAGVLSPQFASQESVSRSGQLNDPFDVRLPVSRTPGLFAPGGGSGGGGPGTRDPERQEGIWNYQDYTARAVCGDDTHPFTGSGYEGNYDGGTFVGAAADYPLVDPYSCPGGICDTLKYPTTLDPNPEPEWRTLDIGDMLPYHWERTNREDFFKRLAPDWTPGAEVGDLDFGIATYFKDVPNAQGFLELRNPNQKPLMAFGDSPVGEALVDWRCFYLGSDMPGGKCRNDVQPFGQGWDWLAPQYDLEWGCRKPFIIVIGDGENNCQGENPSADTANLRRNRIKAWVINFGGPDSRDLRTLAQNTGGEYVEVSDRDQLLTVLENILGEIVEETRAFASAVVPTVQAEEADKVFVSNFKPLNQESVWPGNVQAFLKPVPIDGAGRPDTSIDCGPGPDDSPASSCFLWNAGEAMLSQVDDDITTQFGNQPTQRRVYYTRLTESGDWPNKRRFLEPTGDSTPDLDAVRYDLWRGFGLILPTIPDGDLADADEDLLQLEANDVIETMMAMKIDDNDTPDDTSDDAEFILGDIFHSDPLIVGAPVNTRFFALNLQDDGSLCEDGNPSYRCFFRKHQNRRKIVMVGSNDASVHAFDAGIYRTSGDFQDGFDRGSGKEVFAFSPRDVLPTIQDLYGDGINRVWTVDGGLTGIDAFIDPLDDTDTFPDADDREWRTIVLGGLRRGGTSFYALDVTQPDKYNSEDEPIGINGYVPSCSDGGEGCGPIPYPARNGCGRS